MAKRIVMDFDNTMGIHGCDVDDGLALLFLIGSDDAVVEGVCTTYGNNTLDTVYANTLRLFDELDIEIPVYRGAKSASPDEPIGDAATYLAQTAAHNPGEINILATGSLTNLGQAAKIDPEFFDNVASITLMGGITKSLVINGALMDELNFSCDPAATLAVLGATCPVTVATAQNCLPAFFRREDLVGRFGEESWLFRTCRYWFDDMDEAYAWEGFTCWDVVAAAMLMRSELFVSDYLDVTLNERLFSVGYLEKAVEGAPCARIATPHIADAQVFVRTALDTWENALSRLRAE